MACLTRPAIPNEYLDEEVMKRTVKLVSRQSYTTSDVLMMVKRVGVSTDDVLGLYRGPPADAGIFLTFSSEASVDRLKASDLRYRDKQFTLTHLGKQVIIVRVHWLPLFFTDSLIKSVLADFGRVLSVEKATTIQDNRHVRNGMRVVRIEVDEVGRRALPHMVKFSCGTSMLLTVPERPLFASNAARWDT